MLEVLHLNDRRGSQQQSETAFYKIFLLQNPMAGKLILQHILLVRNN